MSKTLKLELLVNGKKKTFSENFIPAGRVLEALKLMEGDDDKDLRDIYTERVDFIAQVFSDPGVTADAIWAGYNAIGFNESIFEIICGIAGVDPKKLKTPTSQE